ncbi:hypothetical protein FNV43_RR23769 [Rhamnella rubrinervis]|uniref:Uncharacterized protein n=1 Tax=Rhamnella rubrinervis TaxID=2594499 RepID=A0A8K0DWU7_9ROSA|nr:hypothetical protein FNV43_RR23769 [Rhamnella rubrinervis]
MTKFNEVQKKRRAQAAERKRRTQGDPCTGKLKHKSQQQSLSVSGKRKRKLLKKWRRDQKEAMQKGLLTMEDIEMAVADGEAEDAQKTSKKFPMKRSKNKGKSPKPASEVSGEAMVE